MKKLSFIFILFICVTIGATNPLAQDTDPPKEKETAKTAKLTAKDYDEMVAKVNRGDMTVDFHQMRLAYTETKQYAPYGGMQERDGMYAAMRSKDYEKALSLAEDRLKQHFVDLNAVYIAALSSKQLSKTTESDFYLKVLKKMMDDILRNGDGLTAKTAIFAIGISEQYFIMSFLGFQRVTKTLERTDGSVFDVHASENPETKETRKFYFNIDKVFGKF
jgi:outer membrane protein assembly factor BamD (BamD/ComL family)